MLHCRTGLFLPCVTSYQTFSQCLAGFTPQYTEMAELQNKYNRQGLEVLAFPCNQVRGGVGWAWAAAFAQHVAPGRSCRTRCCLALLGCTHANAAEALLVAACARLPFRMSPIMPHHSLHSPAARLCSLAPRSPAATRRSSPLPSARASRVPWWVNGCCWLAGWQQMPPACIQHRGGVQMPCLAGSPLAATSAAPAPLAPH